MATGVWHYTYYSYEEGGRGYIGKRTSSVPPESDPYLGSFSDKTFKPTRKTVIAVFDSAERACESEIALQVLFNVGKEEHFANKKIHSSPSFTNSRRKPNWKNLRTTEEIMEIRRSANSLRKLEASMSQEYIAEWLPAIELINKDRRRLIDEGRVSELSSLFLLKNPYGTTYPIDNLEGFCERLDLDLSSIQKLCNGSIDSWNGWTRGEKVFYGLDD